MNVSLSIEAMARVMARLDIPTTALAYIEADRMTRQDERDQAAELRFQQWFQQWLQQREDR